MRYDFDDSKVKIGKSHNPEQRRRCIEGQHDFLVETLCVFPSKGSFEKQVHKACTKSKHTKQAQKENTKNTHNKQAMHVNGFQFFSRFLYDFLCFPIVFY